MIDYFREHLGAKLFLSYLVVILVGAIVLGVSTQFTARTAFDRHIGAMEEFSPKGEGQNAPENGGNFRGGFIKRLYNGFWQSLRDAMNLAALVAGFAALLVSLYLSNRIVTPVRAMKTASQRIAKGHYDERVHEEGADELSQLAQSFNQMAAELEKVEEMRRQLIGDVAHELRTPLTTIKGSVEALEDGILPASPETYELILREADRLNHLVDDLQELSRVEAGAYELNLSPVDFSAIKETIQKRFGYQFEEKGISFKSDMPDNLPSIRADEHRIIQILTNLLTNALHYTPKGGKVNLNASLVDEAIQISVKDNGIGIPPEHLKDIFTRFYRVDKSRSRHAGGSGIGLTITKHLVEAHGGRIWVESEGRNTGSLFICEIPIK